MKFDYDEVAKKIIEQLAGQLVIVTLIIFINEYLAFVKRNRAAKTYEGVKLVADHLLAFFSPERRIDTIQLKDAENFIEWLKRKAPKGVYNYLKVLLTMFNKGIQWGYLRSNIFVKIQLAKRQIIKPSYVTEEMLDRIIPFINLQIIKDIVLVTFYTACRLGEIVNLTFGDINLKENVIMIGNKNFQTKGRKQRIVPMHPKVREIFLMKVRSKKIKVKSEGLDSEATTVMRLHDKDSYVFAKSNGHKFTTDYVSKRFKKACRDAGIDEAIHYHSLRHGAITKMLMNGAALPAVQRIAGHSDIKITMGYTHPDLQSLRDAVGRL